MRVYTVTIGNNGTNLDHRDIKASRAAGSTKREFVTGVIDNLGKAIDTERAIRDEHPEYKFVSWKRVEVQP